MAVIEALVLGAVQGVAEFLPISSSGHIVLTSWLFGWDKPGVAFDAVAHLGTLAAVLVVFAREWLLLARSVVGRSATGGAATLVDEIAGRRLVALLIAGTIPVAIVGLAVRDGLDGTFRDPTWAAVFLLATAGVLLLGERYGRRSRSLASLQLRGAGAVGLAQAVAVLPGVSRSGMTMVAGLLQHQTRESAARFSFYLAAPAVFGAALVALVDLAADGSGEVGAGALAVATVTSFLTALVAIRGLLALVRRASFRPFAAYCLLAGGAVLIARAAGA